MRVAPSRRQRSSASATLGVATPAMAEAIARMLSDALDAARMVAGI